MGICGNALDYYYRSWDQNPRMFGELARLCVEAALIDPNSCALASASLKSQDPVLDIAGRIDNIIASLSSTP